MVTSRSKQWALQADKTCPFLRQQTQPSQSQPFPQSRPSLLLASPSFLPAAAHASPHCPSIPMAGRGQGPEEIAPLFGSGGDDASELRRETAEPRSGREVAQDRISSLCDDLLLKILVLLPLVEAIRTCILSRRWRGVWTRLPRLELDDGAARAAGVEGFVDLVDGALQHHSVDVDVDELLIRVSQPTSIDAARLAAWTAFAAERVVGN
ncbi:hypothetical protein ACP70R_005679 [Stipagrostis hirtigluma subsp. patula]